MTASERAELIVLSLSVFLFLIGAASALLALYLYRKLPKPTEQEWNGRSFDPAGVAPRLDALRRDYLNEPRLHTPAGHSRGRLAAARALVTQRAYFGTDRTDQDNQPEEMGCEDALPGRRS